MDNTLFDSLLIADLELDFGIKREKNNERILAGLNEESFRIAIDDIEMRLAF
ncbi:MAG: hypothetical protein MJY41_00005 [Bacteroidales bacterium]|nr:hypothetical protein [Bacteroidales bacterium]